MMIYDIKLFKICKYIFFFVYLAILFSLLNLSITQCMGQSDSLEESSEIHDELPNRNDANYETSEDSSEIHNELPNRNEKSSKKRQDAKYELRINIEPKSSIRNTSIMLNINFKNRDKNHDKLIVKYIRCSLKSPFKAKLTEKNKGKNAKIITTRSIEIPSFNTKMNEDRNFSYAILIAPKYPYTDLLNMFAIVSDRNRLSVFRCITRESRN